MSDRREDKIHIRKAVVAAGCRLSEEALEDIRKAVAKKEVKSNVQQN